MWNGTQMLQCQLVLRHKIEKLEPSYANAIIQYANIAKSSWISWYAFSAPDEAIQALINEAKSYYMRLPTVQHLPQLPLLQPPSTWYDYESPSLYLEPQFQSLNIPGDCMPRDYLNAQVKVLSSGVPQMHNQRQSHPRGSQRDFFGHNQRQSHPCGSQRDFFGASPEFTIYITIAKNRLTWKNIRDYFKKFGPVISVYIPCKPDNEKHNFGFVTFQNDDTVRLLLSKSTSHSIRGVEVRVKPYQERTKQEQRQLPQKNDHFDNVAHRTSCANAIDGHSGQKLPNIIELSQEILKRRFGKNDSPLIHNLSEKKTESPEDDHATKESNVDESSELPAMERCLPHDLFSEKQRR